LSWENKWLEYQDRIDACITSIEQLNSMKSHDAGRGAWTHFTLPYFCELYIDIKSNISQFPIEIKDVLERVFNNPLNEQIESLTKDKQVGNDYTYYANIITFLHVLKSKVNSLLNNSDSKTIKKVEYSLILLNKLLEISKLEKEEWWNAWESKRPEESCERLGHILLLKNDVWSAKIGAKGSKAEGVSGQETDLCILDISSEDRYGELNQSEVRRAGVQIVLTEWKVVKECDKLEGIIASAKKQLKRYSKGITYGLGLEKTRYIILVSQKSLNIQSNEIIEDGITYKIRNVIIAPKSPSA
jgi:hypothetical protein